MVHHEISAALARERVNSYLAEAEAARQARHARPGRRGAAAGRAALAAWLVSFGGRLSQAHRPRRLYGNQPRLRRAGRSA